MKTKLIYGLLAGLLPALSPAVNGSVLGDLAASMKAGEWKTLSTNNISPVLSDPGASGNVFGFTEDIVWDPGSKQLLYVGGDHNATGVFAAYSDASNTWSRMACPYWIGSCGVAQGGTAMHGYDHNAINVKTGEIFYRTPYGDYKGNVYTYSVSGANWGRLPDFYTSEYDGGFYGIEYFPDLKGLFVYNYSGGNGAVHLYNDSAKTWSTIAGNLTNNNDYHSFAEYNPVHKVMLFGNKSSLFKMDGAKKVTVLKTPPVSLGVVSAIVTVDPVNGDYLIFTSGREFYVYDALSDIWTKKTSTVPIWSSNAAGGVSNNVATPVSTYGINLFSTCNSGNCRVDVYRHAPQVGTESGPRPRSAASFGIWPNPARGPVRLVMPEGPAILSASLHNALGKRLLTLPAGETGWSMAGYPAGVYIVRLTAADGSVRIAKLLKP